MLTHTKEKPHECEICKNNFSHKFNLNVHIRIHTRDRSFVCDVCHRRFSTRSSRNSHFRTHQQQQNRLSFS